MKDKVVSMRVNGELLASAKKWCEDNGSNLSIQMTLLLEKLAEEKILLTKFEVREMK